MASIRRRTAVGAGLVALATGVFALAVLRPPLLGWVVERVLAPAGGRASVGAAAWTLGPPGLALDGVVLVGPVPGDVLRIERLRLEVRPRALVGLGPWLRKVDVRGVRLVRSAPRPAGGVDLSALGWLLRVGDFSVTDAAVRMEAAGGTLTVRVPRFAVAPVPRPGAPFDARFDAAASFAFTRECRTVADARVEGVGRRSGSALEADLRLGGLSLDLGGAVGRGFGRSTVRLTAGRLDAGLSLELPAARLGPGEDGGGTKVPTRLRVSGGLGLAGTDVRLTVAEFSAGDLLVATGALGGPTLQKLRGRLEGRLRDAGRVARVLGDLAAPGWRAVSLRGALPFRLEVAGPIVGATLFPEGLTVSLPSRGLVLGLSGAPGASGNLSEWRRGAAALGGSLEAAGTWQGSELAVRGFRARLPLAGTVASPRVAAFGLSVRAGGLLYRGRALVGAPIEAAGSAAWSDGTLALGRLRASAAGLGSLAGELAFGRGGTRATVEGGGLAFAGVLAAVAAAAGREWGSWPSTGVVDLALRLRPGAGEPTLGLRAGFAGVGFSSPAGEVAVQGLTGTLGIGGALGSRPRLRADLACPRGEALWGTVYADLSRNPLDLRVSVARHGADRLEAVALDADARGLGRAAFRGSARRERGAWQPRGTLSVAEAQVGPLFRMLLRDPLAASQPGLAGLEAEGTAAAELALVRSGKGTGLGGRVSLRGGGLRRSGAPALASGVELDLPVEYVLGAGDPGRAAPGVRGWGRLGCRELRLGSQRLGPLSLPVALVPNRLYVEGEVEVPLFGGTLSLAGVQVDEPLSGKRVLRLGALVERVELARLGTSPLLQGTVGGRLDPVRLDGEALTADGTLTGDFLGGRIELDHLTVLRPAAPGREFGADVRFSLVDLERLSAAANVGRITGRLSGAVTGLRVAYGQPVAFHLRLESVRVPGERRLVNLKAVNAISLLGTGSALGGVGLSLLTRVFREFPYERIGAECDLRNDVFTVRGLVREGGVEYLVKRPLLGGLNVVNRNPENRIAFSDMLDRFRRVTAGPAPPTGERRSP